MGSAAKKTSTGKKNIIGDFFVDKVDGDVMRKYLAEAKIPEDRVDPSCETDEQLAAALTLYFREEIEAGKLTEDDLAKCEDRCGGEGPADVSACVFCGLESDPDPVSKDVDVTSTEALAAQVEAEEPKTPKKSKTKTPPEEKPEATTNKKAKDTDMTKSTALATTNKKSKDLATTEAHYTDKDLDKAVERVIQCKKVAAVGLWALGEELKKINESKLWKLRTVKGKAAYTSFDQFCDTEAKISHTYAYQLIEIAKAFTEQDVSKFGTSKLTLMLKVAPEDLPAVREKAATSTKRELAKEVEKVVTARGHGAKRSEKHAAAGKKGAKAKIAKAPKLDDKITIATIMGTKRIKLFAKPDSIRNIDWKSLKRAKTPAALPFGKWEMTNEVTLLISIVQTEDGLEAIVNVRRDTAED